MALVPLRSLPSPDVAKPQLQLRLYPPSRQPHADLEHRNPARRYEKRNKQSEILTTNLPASTILPSRTASKVLPNSVSYYAYAVSISAAVVQSNSPGHHMLQRSCSGCDLSFLRLAPNRAVSAHTVHARYASPLPCSAC